jgi:hypothetical protein
MCCKTEREKDQSWGERQHRYLTRQKLSYNTLDSDFEGSERFEVLVIDNSH